MRHSVGAERTGAGASAMDDQGEPTAGQWADDPSGRHRFRWWDGSQWTGHVFDGEHPPNRAPGTPARQGARRPRREPRRARGDAQVEAGVEADVEAGVDGDDDEPRPRRGGPLAGLSDKGFWTGAAAGGAVVAFIAVLASVALGGGGDSSTATTTTSEATTTSTEATTTSTAVTTTTLAPGRPVAEVRLQVLNASGVSGAATEKSDALRTLGYTIAGAGNAPTRKGTIVQCNTGFDAEAAQLAVAVGGGATVQAAQTAGTTVPAGSDCVVILGTP